MNSGAPSAVHAILQALASLELHRPAGGNLHGLASGRVTAFTRRAIGNPEFSINDGAWMSSATTVASGAKVKVRLTSSATGGAKHSATLTIGGVSDTWDVTTANAPAPGDVTAKGVYAGEYSGAPLYTTAADEGITWYNDSKWPWNPVVQGADSTSDGKPNTDKLVNATSGYPPYQAAVLCRNKGPD